MCMYAPRMTPKHESMPWCWSGSLAHADMPPLQKWSFVKRDKGKRKRANKTPGCVYSSNRKSAKVKCDNENKVAGGLDYAATAVTKIQTTVQKKKRAP